MSRAIAMLLISLAVLHAAAPAAVRAQDAAPTLESERQLDPALFEQRAKIARVHRAFGIATMASVTATAWLGYIQYFNRYGLFEGFDSTRCARGDAIFGQRQCEGQAWPHLTLATLTAATYTTTFALSLAMPDTSAAHDPEGEHMQKLETHKTLRWIHLGGMVFQIVLGTLVANPGWLGLDRQDDHRTLQGLATVHALAGLVTTTAIWWAGWIMLF